MDHSEDREIGRLKIGGAEIVSAEFPIRKSHFTLWTKPFRSPPLDDQIVVQLGRVIVYALDTTNSSIEWWLSVVNMSNAAVCVRTITVHRVFAAGYDVPRLAAIVPPLQNPIASKSAGDLYVKCPLSIEGIEMLRRVIQRASNLYSSPTCRIEIEGAFDVSQGKKSATIPFRLPTPSPMLMFSSAVAGD